MTDFIDNLKDLFTIKDSTDVILTALTVVVGWLAYQLNKRQRQDSLVSAYAYLNESLWSSDVIKSVRKHLLQDKDYEVLKKAVSVRVRSSEKFKSSNLNDAQFHLVDNLDCFINLLLRVTFIPKSIKNSDKSMGGAYFDWWIRALVLYERIEVIDYIYKYYAKLANILDRVDEKRGHKLFVLSNTEAIKNHYTEANRHRKSQVDPPEKYLAHCHISGKFNYWLRDYADFIEGRKQRYVTQNIWRRIIRAFNGIRRYFRNALGFDSRDQFSFKNCKKILENNKNSIDSVTIVREDQHVIVTISKEQSARQYIQDLIGFIGEYDISKKKEDIKFRYEDLGELKRKLRKA